MRCPRSPLPPSRAWRRRGSGARLHDWACLGLADLEAGEFNRALSGTWTRGPLIRRKPADGGCACFTTWCPAGTGAATLAAAEGRRWAIEDSLEAARSELGPGHNETRSWHGWYRHASLVTLASAMMASTRHRANQPAPSHTPRNPTRRRLPSSAGPSRTCAAPQRAWPKPASSPHLPSPGQPGEGRTRPAHSAHTRNTRQERNCNGNPRPAPTFGKTQPPRKRRHCGAPLSRGSPGADSAVPSAPSAALLRP